MQIKARMGSTPTIVYKKGYKHFGITAGFYEGGRENQQM
jgi:hypothetical protein